LLDNALLMRRRAPFTGRAWIETCNGCSAAARARVARPLPGARGLKPLMRKTLGNTWVVARPLPGARGLKQRQREGVDVHD
jgi:hypothetical protein